MISRSVAVVQLATSVLLSIVKQGALSFSIVNCDDILLDCQLPILSSEKALGYLVRVRDEGEDLRADAQV